MMGRCGFKRRASTILFTIVHVLFQGLISHVTCANIETSSSPPNLSTWPQLLLTIQKNDSQYEVTLVDPITNTSQIIANDNGLDTQGLAEFPMAAGSAIAGIVCHERWTFSCKTIKDGQPINLNLLTGVDDSPNHKKHRLHLDMNPYDGAHVMYLEPIRQAAWIVNLHKNVAKLVSTFDGQNIINIKVDWTKGLLFTANSSVVSVYGIEADKLQLHDTFAANATYLASDSELGLLYWTDARGSIYKRHYDQLEVELLADSACLTISKTGKDSFSPLYVFNGSVICIHNQGGTLELERLGVLSSSTILLGKSEKLLHYNLYSGTEGSSEFMQKMTQTCAKCSHLCIPVNITNQFQCACAYGFRLINDYECETPAVLALRVKVSEHMKDAPEGATDALLLHDFGAMPPSTWTYAYESSSFRIVLSDTFHHVCLQFSGNNSVECFSPFTFDAANHSNRSEVWKASKNDIVMKVAGDSKIGFDVYFYGDYCLKVYKQNTRRNYPLACDAELDTNNTFIDHLRYKIYEAARHGIIVQDPSTQSYNGWDENHKLQRGNSSRRQFYLNVTTETAVFFPGQNDQFHYIDVKNSKFLKRSVGPGRGDTQSQALIYRNKILWAQDSRIYVIDTDEAAGAEILRTSMDKDTDFTVVEKPTTPETTEIPDPCRSQTECPHLCKSDENLQNYECLCPPKLALNGADVCKPSLLSLARLEDDKLTFHSNIIEGYGNGKIKDIKELPTLFRFREIFLHEPNLKRICVAQCGRDGCDIDCTTYGKYAKLPTKIRTDSTKILHMVKKHSSHPAKSDDLYWISDESEDTLRLNRMCLNVVSPRRKFSIRLSCFPESALMLDSHYVEALSTLFWLKSDSSGSKTECRLRAFFVGSGVVNTPEVVQLTSFLGSCYGLAVGASVSKIYVLTSLALHEFDMSTEPPTRRQIRAIDFKPSIGILKEFNGFVFTVGRQNGGPNAVKMFGPVSSLNLYLSSNKIPIVDIHISTSEPTEEANATGFACTLSCKYHCEIKVGNSEPNCACPMVAPPTYGRQWQECAEESPDEGSNTMESSQAGAPAQWWPVLLGVVLIVAITGACQAICWRRMKRRQDLLFRRAFQSFMQGNDAKAQNAKNESERALHLPFTLVIPPDQLKITGTCLGEGNYGQVYKGEYKNQQVAVKTVKDNLENQVVQDFLKELKIMAYVGMHANIVEFLGAEISEIQKGLVRVVLELCCFGSLESVLRGFTQIDSSEKHDDGYILVQEEAEIPTQSHAGHQAVQVIQLNLISQHDYKNLETSADSKAQLSSTVSLLQLKKWAQQIASGMDYLERKNVVHGDLATRNVLVCDDLTVKISDFGFSKNMYQSETYRKKKSCPLPWRWASPETLICLEFSFKADVWSYGVTVWEIFSLGAVPFPDLTWDGDFIRKVQDGLRPSKPQQMPLELYQRVLMACWNLVPSDRPSFGTLISSWST